MKQAQQRRNKPIHLLPRAPGYLACATDFSDSHYRSLELALQRSDREQSLQEQATQEKLLAPHK